jgi:hypothetical protein
MGWIGARWVVRLVVQALAEIIETEMAAAVDRHLGEGGAMQRGLGGRAAKLSQVA